MTNLTANANLTAGENLTAATGAAVAPGSTAGARPCALPPLDEPYALTAQQVEAYRRDGHVFLPRVLSPEEVAAYRPHVREAVRRQQSKMSDAERELGGSSSHIAFTLQEATPGLRGLLTSRRLARVGAELLGADAVRILHYYGFFKAPGGPGTPWHQDSLFLPLDRDVVTIWLPLVHVPAPVAMTFAAGSQRLGFVNLGGGGEGDDDHVRLDMLRRGFAFDEMKTMRPGDADYHSGMVVHCAPANTCAYTREVIAVCYYPAESRLVPAEEVLRHPCGEAGFYYRSALRRQYFPGAADGEVAAGEWNPVVHEATEARGPQTAARVEGRAEPPQPFESDYELSAPQVEHFRRKGHVLLRAVATPSEIAEFAPAIREAVYGHGPRRHSMERAVGGDEQGWRFINNLWRLDEAARRLVVGRRFGKLAADLLGVNGVRLFRDQSFFKMPGGGSTPWHQDSYYIPLDTDRLITMWIALAPVTTGMALMSFVDSPPGLGYAGTSLPDDDSMDDFERGMSRRGLGLTCYGALGAGDATFHHGWTPHASRTNLSDAERQAMVVVYFADGARVSLPEVSADAPAQEAFAAVIREQNLRESLPGLGPGDLADTEMTPVVYERGDDPLHS